MTPTPTTAEAVIDKIDEALKDDNLETRQGLRFMATVMKQALQVIGDVATANETITTRLGPMEVALNQFLLAQEKKEKRADEERTKWRWVIITPMIAYVGVEIIKWIFR